VAGQAVFGTSPGPGWGHSTSSGQAKENQFEDSRPDHQGPLAASWAKYRGLYLFERQVVLSYTVGKSKVLESPGLQNANGSPVFTRTFQLDAPAAQTLLVCDGLPKELVKQVTGARALLQLGGLEAVSSRGPKALAVALLGTRTASLEARDGRVVLKLSGKEPRGEHFTVAVWSGAAAEPGQCESVLQQLQPGPNLPVLTQGGPARWPEPIVTRGALATSGGESPYVVDTLSEPVPNPWKMNTFFGGFDFFPDGRAAICTFHGDVWVVSGLDEKLEKISWRRYATGLFQPLGVKVVDNVIYVVGRDQLTRLHDLNGDGEADFYENFNNDTVVTANYHEFCLDLQTDRAGNFYYAKGSPWTPDVRSPHQGTMLKVSKDGSQLEVYATGLRAPNGSGMSPRGQLTVSDNQGHWMPASKLNLVKPGGFYGMTPAAHRELTLRRGGTNLTVNPSDPAERARLRLPGFDGQAPIPTSYDQPICWLPMTMDNSSGGQVWVTSKRWGPFQDHMLFTSYGRGTLFHVMLEEVDGVTQAAMTKFPLKFQTGLMRGRCNPKDGQIYLCGLRGWQTDGTKEGGFYRVRYTGKPVHMPVAVHALKDGLEIQFAGALDAGAAGDPAGYAVEEWNYLYTGNYGSPEFSAIDPTSKKHDRLEIKSARLAKDKKTVLLEIADFKPADQLKVKLSLKAANGMPIDQELYSTVHKLGVRSVAAIP